MNTLILWILLGLTLFTILYINDLPKLLLFIFLITILRIYTMNMIVVLSLSLFLFISFNIFIILLKSLNISNNSFEYHILNRVKFINNDGLLLNEKTYIKQELPYINKNEWLDIQQMIFNYNKLRPIID